MEFRTDVFDAASIETLIERLQRVLVAITADPQRRLQSVDLLDESERARLDELGNHAVLTRSADDGSVPALFAAQVARTPDAVALVCDGRIADLPASSTMRRTGWRIYWPPTAPGRDSQWRCCFRGPRSPSSQSWRY